METETLVAGPGAGVPAVAPPGGVRPAEPAGDRPVVVRVPNWIGDAVLALPAVAAILDRFPERDVHVMARRGVAPIFAGLPRVAAVMEAGGGGAVRFARARKALRGTRCAVGVALSHSMGAAMELAVGGVDEVWGFGGPVRGLALDVVLPRRWVAGRHRWEAYALLAAAVTGRPVVERYPLPDAPGDAAAADELFSEARAAWGNGGPVVGLVPGANGRSRRWPVERFAEVAARLSQRGVGTAVLGSEGDAGLARTIALRAGPRVVDWTGRTPLPVLAACFRRLDFVVTNDTGPMHLAAAVGAPLLDLCGAADDAVTGPRGPASEVVVHPVSCRPCVRNACAYNLECMTGISVDFVVDHVGRRLGL